MASLASNISDSVATNRTLYKYRSDNEYTERILTSRSVWLSTSAELNDPFECSLQETAAEWVDAQVALAKQAQLSGFLFGLRGANERGTHFFGLSREQLSTMHESFLSEHDFDVAYRRMRNFLELASGAPPSDPERLFSDLDDRLNSAGIFSMSECPDHALMWAHYGGNHTGICLGFLATEASALADPERCLPVRYSSQLPEVPKEGLRTTLSVRIGANGTPTSTNQIAFNDSTFQSAITTKAECWAYEREWRYVEPVAGEYSWPGRLSEITFGLRCQKQRRDHYISLVEEFAFGEIEAFQIEKVQNTNELARKSLGMITGKASPFLPDQDGDSKQRVARARLLADQIEQLTRDGDYSEALSILDSQLVQNPNFVPALFQKGVALGYLGDHKSALALFESCCVQQPEYAGFWYQKGVALTQLGRLSEAITALRKARALDPLDASTELNLGVLLVETGQIVEGRRSLEAAAKNGHPRAVGILERLSTLGAGRPPHETNSSSKTGRNAQCPCGSGKKHKKCHGK